MMAVLEEDKKMKMEDAIRCRQQAQEVLNKANKKSPPPSVQVLQGAYEGAAYRSKSIKLAKRTPATQDDDEDVLLEPTLDRSTIQERRHSLFSITSVKYLQGRVIYIDRIRINYNYFKSFLLGQIKSR